MLKGPVCLLNGAEALKLEFTQILGKETAAFETFLARLRGAKYQVFGLSLHLERLVHGVRELFELEVDTHKLRSALHAALANLQLPTCRVRIVVRQNDWLLFLDQFSDAWEECLARQGGVRCISFNAERATPHLKNTLAPVSIEARRKAESMASQEALLVDRAGVLREGAWSNFFWLDNGGRLFTPKTGILRGVTREIVITKLGLEVYEQDLLLSEILQSAKQAFITQATRGIVPVISIQNRNFELEPESFEKVLTLRRRYNELFTNGSLVETVL